MHVLYPVIAKLGEDNELVSLASWSTLLRIAFYCGYSSVLDLVQRNTDYLIDSLIRQMRYFKNYSTSLRVLNGLLKHTGEITRLFRALCRRSATQIFVGRPSSSAAVEGYYG